MKNKVLNTGTEYLPYKFTGKEMDEETGLYYYGARYLDPKYSLWISTDPALSKYIPKINEDLTRLPGGGIYDPVNLNLYHYAGNNPIIYIDPEGNFKTKQFVFATLQTFGGVAEVTASCAAAVGTTGLSAGLTIYGILDGITNIGDGLAGMISAAKDIEYRGIIPESTTLIAEGLGVKNENAELLGDVVGLAKAIVDMDVLDLPSLEKGLNSGSKIIKGIDKVSEYGGRISTYDSGLETGAEVLSKVKNTTQSNSSDNNISKQKMMDLYNEHH